MIVLPSKVKTTTKFETDIAGMIYPIMIIDRLLTKNELNEIVAICDKEVAKNYLMQNGRYFKSIVVTQTFSDTGGIKIVAIGGYFKDRLLIEFDSVNQVYTNDKLWYCITLDDHSGPEQHNNDCAIALQKYLLKKGAIIVL